MVLSKDMKIAICFGLIMGALISICNMCFASEDISYDGIVSNAVIYEEVIVPNNNFSLYYVELEPGYKYIVTSNQNVGVAFGNGLEYGDETTALTSISKDTTFSFTYSDMKYAYFFSTADNSTMTFRLSIAREPLQGMTNFVDNMAYSLSIGNLSNVFDLVVPILAISVLLGLGFYLLKRLLNKIKRAKGGA